MCEIIGLLIFLFILIEALFPGRSGSRPREVYHRHDHYHHKR
jgi:hypothetical protein